MTRAVNSPLSGLRDHGLCNTAYSASPIGKHYHILHNDGTAADGTGNGGAVDAADCLATNSLKVDTLGYTHVDIMVAFTVALPDAGEAVILGFRDDRQFLGLTKNDSSQDMWQLLKDENGNRTITFSYGADLANSPRNDESGTAWYLSDPVHLDVRGCRFITAGLISVVTNATASKIICGLC